MRKLVWMAAAAAAVLGAGTAGAQDTPRKGGSVRSRPFNYGGTGAWRSRTLMLRT